MENKKLSLGDLATGTRAVEYWQPTMELRWTQANSENMANCVAQEYIVPSPIPNMGDMHCVQNLVLQQKWFSDFGKIEWRDVEVKKS